VIDLRVTIEHGEMGAHTASERGDAVAIIDVLRASTTYTAMLYQGAKKIVPCRSIEQVEQLAEKMPNAIKSGERQCRMIEGFDLGSSPSKILGEDLTGKVILSSTTNGSKMAAAARNAPIMLMAGFCNLSQACRILADSGLEISLICSGREGIPVPEDSVCAMMMASLLFGSTEMPISQVEIEQISCRSDSYLTLEKAGLIEDFQICMNIDRFPMVPRFEGNGFVCPK
jgi:2-phosphosulfolactate phosphatase